MLTSLTQTRQSTQSTSTLSSICFVPRPPGCLPLRVTECGQHGYWFSPATVYPEDLEFELVVEGKADEVSPGSFLSLYLKRCIVSGHTSEDTEVFIYPVGRCGCRNG